MFTTITENLINKKDTDTGRPVISVIGSQSGFTLVEMVVASVVLLIAVLGAFSVFTYAVMYNTGNSNRSQALAILQQEVELIRSAKFTPAVTDTNLTGGEKAPKIVTAADGTNFKVETIVDDDPYTGGVQINNNKTLKNITITVTPESKTSEWQFSIPITTVIRRVRSN